MNFFLPTAVLLFVATPALSADAIYLKCANEMTAESTGINAGKPVKKIETTSETAFFKIIPADSRFASYSSSSTPGELKWDEATITDNALSANINENNELMEVNGVLTVELNPPGALTSKISAAAFGMITSEIDIVGTCVAIEGSEFEEGLKKPSS